jgi:hypothetical protein
MGPLLFGALMQALESAFALAVTAVGLLLLGQPVVRRVTGPRRRRPP